MVTPKSSICIDRPSENVANSRNFICTTFAAISRRLLLHWALPPIAFASALRIHRSGFYHSIWSFHLIRDRYGVGFCIGSFSSAPVCRTLSAWSYRPHIFPAFADTSLRFANILKSWSIQFDSMWIKFMAMQKINRIQVHGKMFIRKLPNWLTCMWKWWSECWVFDYICKLFNEFHFANSGFLIWWRVSIAVRFFHFYPSMACCWACRCTPLRMSVKWTLCFLIRSYSKNNSLHQPVSIFSRISFWWYFSSTCCVLFVHWCGVRCSAILPTWQAIDFHRLAIQCSRRIGTITQ